MSLRYDGRVAIVTGAGNGLGRTYAIELAKRGAKVVVNDLGGSTKGEGRDTSAADKVVAEIKAAGGEAVANYDSVVNGAGIVKTAIDTYGKIDIVINNAGILNDTTFAKLTDAQWNLMQQVHLNGAYSVTHAAWPYLQKQKYGRIIMVTSAAGLYGNFGQSHYSTVKMGILGLAQTLALEGAKQNIRVNVIAPIAGSRMTETVMPPDLIQALKPDYVAPLVLYLTHDTSQETGGVYELGAGWISKLRWQRTKGVFFPLDTEKFTIEAVQQQMGKIADFSGEVSYPSTPRDAFEPIMANLANPVTTTEEAKPKAKQGGDKDSSSAVDVSAALAHTFPSLSFNYTEKEVILYALGIGAGADPCDDADRKFVYEGADDFQTFPTFGVVVPSDVLSGMMSIPGLTFNPMMLLHGEQYMEIRRPIPTSGVLKTSARVSNILDKGKGALVLLDAVTKDEQGQDVVFNQYSLFIRGLGGFSKNQTLPKVTPTAPPAGQTEPPLAPPDVVHREKTLENQAVLYRLSGDRNPLHIDPSMASMGGFAKPILHGLCSFGYAARAVIKHCAANDASRMKSIRVRFASPVYPGETLVTEMWRVCPTRILFRCKVAERGEYVLSNCVIELFPLPGEEQAANAAAAAAAGTQAAAAPQKSTGFKAEAVFSELKSRASADLVKKISSTYRFDISRDGTTHSWLLNLKEGSGSVTMVDSSAKADCMISISDDDFVELMAGKLNAQQAFMKGKIKIKGNMMLAQKLSLLQSAAPAKGAAPAPATPAKAAAPASAAGGSFKAQGVFAELTKQASPDLVAKIKSTYRFDITKDGTTRSWLLNLKEGSGSVSIVDASSKADCMISISDDDFVDLMNGKLNAQQAFMKGKIKIKGNMMLAQKLSLLQQKPSKL